MRAAGCKNLSKSPKGDFRQSEAAAESRGLSPYLW